MKEHVSADVPPLEKPAVKVPILKRFNVRLKRNPKVVEVDRRLDAQIDQVGPVEKQIAQVNQSPRGSPKWKDRMGSSTEVERVQKLAESAKHHLALNLENRSME